MQRTYTISAPPPMLPPLERPKVDCKTRTKRARPEPSEPKAAPAPPKGKGGELWQKLYADAQRAQMADPEKFADSCLRARERALDLDAQRAKLQRTNKIVKC